MRGFAHRHWGSDDEGVVSQGGSSMNAERKHREGFLVGTGKSEMVRGVGDTAARLDLNCPA
jgi:hypothetical protein